MWWILRGRQAGQPSLTSDLDALLLTPEVADNDLVRRVVSALRDIRQTVYQQEQLLNGNPLPYYLPDQLQQSLVACLAVNERTPAQKDSASATQGDAVILTNTDAQKITATTVLEALEVCDSEYRGSHFEQDRAQADHFADFRSALQACSAAHSHRHVWAGTVVAAIRQKGGLYSGTRYPMTLDHSMVRRLGQTALTRTNTLPAAAPAASNTARPLTSAGSRATARPLRALAAQTAQTSATTTTPNASGVPLGQCVNCILGHGKAPNTEEVKHSVRQCQEECRIQCKYCGLHHFHHQCPKNPHFDVNKGVIMSLEVIVSALGDRLTNPRARRAIAYQLPQSFTEAFGHSTITVPSNNPITPWTAGRRLSATGAESLGFNNAFCQAIHNGVPLLVCRNIASYHRENYRSVETHLDKVAGERQWLIDKGYVEECICRPYVVSPLGAIVKTAQRYR
ncbi:unnamed protein product [Vitrella brassicaformis CCMP3155]|uniref:Uncharacterized protein n=1 Tax=Vitrella brassicaformis (strain CCMP3155) TaxID=1169540 RepID=A0A0G4H849_VITBC|nr:unnamed protein product [Vitrella brassicaformis CCMP3155]|eukprot:CEM39914.1 unnamed protein product [Vitrella brassicaformis CCMP3155]